MNKEILNQLIGKHVQHLHPVQNLTITDITEKTDNIGNVEINFNFNKKFTSNIIKNKEYWASCNDRYFFNHFRVL